MRVLFAHKKPISSLAFTHDGAHLAEAAHGSVRVWDVATGEVVHTIDVPGKFPNQVRVAFSPDGKTLAIANEYVELVELANGERVRLKSTPSRYDPFTGVCFSPNGRQITAAGHQWRMWDTATDKPLPQPDWAKKKAGWLSGWTAFAFSPDGSRFAATLATSSRPPNTMFVLDNRRNKLVGSFDWDSNAPAKVVLLPPDKKTVIGACGPFLRAWDIATGKEIAAVTAGKKHFMDAALSPDGQWIATVSKDRTARLWDTRNWGEPRTYDWEIGELLAVAFAPDGQTIAVGSNKGKILLFDVD